MAIATKDVLAIGPCTFSFKLIGGSAETVDILMTEEEADTTLSSEVSIFEILADQAIGPVHSQISGITVTMNASIFFNPETASMLTAEWEKGATGFALGNVGGVPPVFELTIKPKGSTEPSQWYVMPYCRVKCDTNITMKKEGKALMALTVTGSSDERAEEKTYGKVLTTGDFTKVSA